MGAIVQNECENERNKVTRLRYVNNQSKEEQTAMAANISAALMVEIPSQASRNYPAKIR